MTFESREDTSLILRLRDARLRLKEARVEVGLPASAPARSRWLLALHERGAPAAGAAPPQPPLPMRGGRAAEAAGPTSWRPRPPHAARNKEAKKVAPGAQTRLFKKRGFPTTKLKMRPGTKIFFSIVFPPIWGPRAGCGGLRARPG